MLLLPGSFSCIPKTICLGLISFWILLETKLFQFLVTWICSICEMCVINICACATKKMLCQLDEHRRIWNRNLIHFVCKNIAHEKYAHAQLKTYCISFEKHGHISVYSFKTDFKIRILKEILINKDNLVQVFTWTPRI